MTTIVKKIEPRRLKGFRDYLPDLMEARSLFQSKIRQHARLAGFREIGTPVLEYAETLLGQGGEETDKQVYRFEDHGGRKVAMRFDLTVPFARFVAEHQGELVFPFKRLQIGDVWRGENTQKGRYREFCQCDLDIIGVDSVNADAEIISCFYRILNDFDIGGFTIRIGNRKLLSALLGAVFLEISEETETQALIALDKLDKIGADAVVELLAKLSPANHVKLRELIKGLTSKDENGDTEKAWMKSMIASNPEAMSELSRMDLLMNVMRSVVNQKPGGSIRLDLSIARGLGYYTGVVVETTLDSLPGFGSISSGGRYNNLAARFTNRELPGVGGSIGLDRLLAGLEEMGKITKPHGDMVFIAIATEDAVTSALELANILRAAGVGCDLGLTTGKVGNQFKHADRLGYRRVVTLGSEEVRGGTYNLKDMVTGEERRGLLRDNIMSEIIVSSKN
jgi:histidyl-tRNA synthetase